MYLKDKYCTVCGRKRARVEAGTYDEHTGEKIFKYATCPITDCRHGYHVFENPVLGKVKPCKNCGISAEITPCGV